MGIESRTQTVRAPAASEWAGTTSKTATKTIDVRMASNAFIGQYYPLPPVSSGKSGRVFRSIKNLSSALRLLIALAGTPAINCSSPANSPVITEPIPTIQRDGIDPPGATPLSDH